MCGIAGATFWNAPQAADLEAVVASMVGALGHRGPDAHAVAACGLRTARPFTVLGHTRLAILDLSERGSQPMQSPRGPFWIAFNGEIYNFADLRAELERAGRVFRSRTDTEVVLQGYEEWGGDVVRHLRGMFAFALWDGDRRELLLARDRLGIKPLYLHRQAGGVLFASEIRALLSTGLVPRALDASALDAFLAHQTVSPPHTLVAGVEMVRPGHTVRVTSTGSVEERPYWSLLDHLASDHPPASDGEARGEIRRLLHEAASLHLVSDVPVGVFLSGGIDSSALVALTRAAGVTPRTFTVVLPGSSHDEARFAKVIADRFDADHHEIPIGARELADEVPEAMLGVDHPSADGFNTFVVSRAVRRAGVKVALSGLGGDELFGGYPSFRRLRRLAAYAPAWRRSPAAVRTMAAAAVRTLGRASVASVKAAAVIESDGSIPQAFSLTRQLFSPVERRRLLESPTGPDDYAARVREAIARHPDLDVMTLVSFAEASTYMHDVLLRDTDQMSMAHGLEARVPLLDDRLVEYVLGLPESVKDPRGTPKRLLVEALDGLLPDECVHRRKQGFVLPFEQWMRGELREFCAAHLGRTGLAGRASFRADAIEALWASFLAHDPRTNWSRPWALIALDCWIEQNRLSA